MDPEGYVVRLRGLPWSVSNEEVISFLEGCNVLDIHFTYVRDGRPSGEAYVELGSEGDVQAALQKNQQHMGKRYIEVFKSKRSEMEWVVEHSGRNHLSDNADSVIRLRGLPFECTKEDISNFFEGLSIVPNGISLLTDQMGRATGDAYVQFTSQSIADRALQKHKEKIGRRYVEIFKSTLTEARSAINAHSHAMTSGGYSRPGPYDRMEKRMGSGMGLGYGSRGSGLGMGRGNIKGMMSKSSNGAGLGMGRGNIKGLMSHRDDGYDDYGYGSGSSYRSSGYSGGGMGMGGGYGGGRSSGRSMQSMGGMSRGGRGGSRGGMRGGRGGGGDSRYVSKTGHSVHMRGLPYSASEDDIQQFFMPLQLENIEMGYNDDGRPSGEADVEFATHADAVQAMRKNNAMMERRYIELFLHSEENSGYSGNSYGGDAAYCDNYTTSTGYGSNYTQF